MWTRNVCLFQVKISVEISFFEIYNEKIHDLLASSKEKNGKKATVSSMIILCFFQSTQPLSKHNSHRFTDCMLNHTHGWKKTFCACTETIQCTCWIDSTGFALHRWPWASIVLFRKNSVLVTTMLCICSRPSEYVGILKAVSFSSVF